MVSVKDITRNNRSQFLKNINNKIIHVNINSVTVLIHITKTTQHRIWILRQFSLHQRYKPFIKILRHTFLPLFRRIVASEMNVGYQNDMARRNPYSFDINLRCCHFYNNCLYILQTISADNHFHQYNIAFNITLPSLLREKHFFKIGRTL